MLCMTVESPGTEKLTFCFHVTHWLYGRPWLLYLQGNWCFRCALGRFGWCMICNSLAEGLLGAWWANSITLLCKFAAARLSSFSVWRTNKVWFVIHLSLAVANATLPHQVHALLLLYLLNGCFCLQKEAYSILNLPAYFTLDASRASLPSGKQCFVPSPCFRNQTVFPHALLKGRRFTEPPVMLAAFGTFGWNVYASWGVMKNLWFSCDRHPMSQTGRSTILTAWFP